MIILSDSEQRLFPRTEGWSLVICVVPRDDEMHAVHQWYRRPTTEDAFGAHERLEEICHRGLVMLKTVC